MMLGGAGALAGGGRIAGVPLPLVQGALPRLVLVPVAFRLALFFQAVWTVEAASLWPAAVLYLVPNVLEFVWVMRWSRRRPGGIRLLLIADTAYAVVTNLGAAVLVPHAQFSDTIALTWPNVLGTVMVWTLLRGTLAGALAIGGAAVLRYAMSAISVTEPPLPGVFLTLVAAVATSLAVVVLVGASMRFALGFGEQRGRMAERERHRRDVHDTVLQVMESLALPAPDDVLDPVGSLDQVRRTARAHALRLRLSLDDDTMAEPGGLQHRLGALAVEMTADGLRVEVVTLSKITDVPEAAVHALHDAAREALRNTLKHAGTSRAVICVEETAEGVTVSVRDHGRGFDVDGRRRGFGIDNSIVARLAEIGGAARIDSTPGQGTRVVLTAPLALGVPVG